MNLYVGNLSPETNEQQLRELFSEFGAIKSVKLIIDPQTGFPKGFGFVEMEEKGSGYDAIDNLDYTWFMGGIISVREAKNNKTQINNRGGGQRGFQKRPGGGGGYNRNGGGGYNSNRSFGSQGGNRSYGNRSYGDNQGNRSYGDNQGNRAYGDSQGNRSYGDDQSNRSYGEGGGSRNYNSTNDSNNYHLD